MSTLVKPADAIRLVRSRSQEQPSKTHAHGRRRIRCDQRVGVRGFAATCSAKLNRPPGAQDPADLGEDGGRVADGAEDQAGDDGFGAGVGQVDAFADDTADLEFNAVPSRGAP